MADRNLPATSAQSPVLPKAIPPVLPASAKASPREDAFRTLSLRVEQIAENARKTGEENKAQFCSINTALDQILAAIKPPPETAASGSVGANGASSANGATGANGASCANGAANAIGATGTGAVHAPGNSVGSEDFHGFSGAPHPLASTIGSSYTSMRQAARKLHSLPSFSGAPEEWPKFIMRYKQTTEAYGYSQIDNSLRLQECLKGEALDAVDSMLNDGDNTDAVIGELESRFGRPELLAQVQLRVVRDILPIPEVRPELIVPYSSKVANMMIYIDQPRTRQYLENPELLEQLVQKLPLSRRHEWGKFAVDLQPYPTIRHFCSWLKEQARSVSLMTPAAILAAAVLPTGSARAKAAPTQQTNNNRRERMLHVGVVDRPKCGICEKTNHVVADCRRFLQKNVFERWDVVRERKLCFKCLGRGHSLAQCESSDRCDIDNCRRQHNQLLHTQRADNNNNNGRTSADQARQSEAGTESASSGGGNGREHVNTCATIIEPETRFRILPVTLYNNGAVVQTLAFLDDGSSATLIEECLANELGLNGPRSVLEMQWMDGRCISEMSQTVSVVISGGRCDQQMFEMAGVRTVKHLDLPTQAIKMKDLVRNNPCLRGLPIDDYDEARPRILIGLKHEYLIVPTRTVSNLSSGPVATHTRLGWVVCGPQRPTVCPVNQVHILQIRLTSPSPPQLDELHQLVKEYFTLENLGVRHEDRVLESRENVRARQIMARTTKRIGDRYETGLLWRRNPISFPDSKEMAVKRLLSVERKMKRDRPLAAEYTTIIENYVLKGYARRLSAEEVQHTGAHTWYLPHFAVVNPNKPGKVRIVFDAAATVNGVSLNSAILKGPDLNRPLLAVLHNFRMGSVGVCADIREMFPQIRIRAADVDAQRFLWRCGDESRPMDVYVMQSMIFGAACSPCSAQYVMNLNADLFAERYPAAVKLIHDAHYVDDFVASFNSEDEAARVTQEIVKIHQHGGFELRGFLSNSEKVLQAVGELKNSETPVNMQFDNEAEKVLGMYWCTEQDAFLFRLMFSRVDPAVVNGTRRPTKREVLSATMSIYDPFGLLANFTIYAKILLQDLWRHGTTWDEPIPEELHTKWKQWLAKLGECRQVRVPRCYAANLAARPVQLHIFADASQTAFATVAYWRIEIAPEQWSIVFISGKSRCAPQKLISIPRLELQAAILATRLNRSIRELHDVMVERTFFWTDSTTVVHWVRSDRLQFRPFVAHRISEILEETAVADWHWVPTLHNAADDATRAKYPVRYEAQNRWINGPHFLELNESQWPVEPADLPCKDGTEEVRPHSVQMVCLIKSHSVIQITRFSSFHRACRTMAFVRRYVRNLRPSTRRRGELQPDEINEAERYLIMAAQREAFGKELASLERGEQLEKDSSIRKLLPHIDKYGVLRVTGRLDTATHLPEDTKNPIILPKQHYLTSLVVEMYHRQLRHQQQAAVVCEVRQRFWVSHLPVLVRRVKSNCMFCRIKSARAEEQIMGQLPVDRLTPFVRPFTYTGVDYFGPLLVAIGRRREKRWVALFTCMTMRAVHLELSSDLSTDAFIICLRNFINIRGVPKRIRSDNGTNFVGASRELREAVDLLDHDAIQRELGTRSIEWRFNCPSNPEAGGCWERLVQSIKRVLAVTLKEVAPQVETLRSLLIEAANIVNSRPLTHLEVSGDDDEPLTPNHFLLGTSNSTQTPALVDDRPLCMRKQWRIAQALKNRFWKRWLLEYIPDLTRRAKGYTERPNLVVGSLVLICDPLLARTNWRRGRVKEVFPGADGRIRSAIVKTSDGELRRPAAKLAVLDVCESSAKTTRFTGGGVDI